VVVAVMVVMVVVVVMGVEVVVEVVVVVFVVACRSRRAAWVHRHCPRERRSRPVPQHAEACCLCLWGK